MRLTTRTNSTVVFSALVIELRRAVSYLATMEELIVVGGGEFACVIIEAARAQRFNVIGFVDPRPCEKTTRRLDVPHLGRDSAIRLFPNAMLALGIGCVSVNPVRQQVVERIDAPAERWARLIHPHTCISPTATLAEGVIVLPGAVICSGAAVARHCVINIGAKIDHDVAVGCFVHVAPEAALGGGSSIGDHAYIGMGAMVRDHVHVAALTTIGMGAVVTREFAPGSTLVGVPARPHRSDGTYSPDLSR